MPAMDVVLEIVGAASAANTGWIYSRLKPLPQSDCFPFQPIAGMARAYGSVGHFAE